MNTAQRAERSSLIGWALTTPVVGALLGRIATKTVFDRLAAVFMVAVILGTALYAWVRPDYNWDMVAYVASALENRHTEAADLHRETWAVIEPGARESQLYHLKFSNPYNLNQWENPEDFQSQLSMYRVKVAYIALLRWLEPLTGLATGSILLSILPSIGVGLLCLWWLGRNDAWQAALFAMPFLLVADYTHMTTAVTPDMLLALVSLAAILLFASGRDLPAYGLLFTSVLIRPDNIVLVFALLIAAVLFRWRALPMLATFAVSLLTVILVQKQGGHPGWWAHFYFSCVQIQNSMAGFAPDFSMVDFVRGYVRGVLVALMHNDWPGLLLVLLAAWALLARAGRMTPRTNMLMFALAIGTLGKFASFPLPDDRFYFVFTGGMVVLLAARWRPRFDLSPDR